MSGCTFEHYIWCYYISELKSLLHYNATHLPIQNTVKSCKLSVTRPCYKTFLGSFVKMLWTHGSLEKLTRHNSIFKNSPVPTLHYLRATTLLGMLQSSSIFFSSPFRPEKQRLWRMLPHERWQDSYGKPDFHGVFRLVSQTSKGLAEIHACIIFGIFSKSNQSPNLTTIYNSCWMCTGPRL